MASRPPPPRVLSGRYRLDGELGRGAAGVVYRAWDLKHEREVALKLLSGEAAAGVGAERFQAEIRTAADLVHPNVLPLLDSGEDGGRLYYVVPRVRGESLQERLEREGPLDVAAAVRIARGVAAALAHAHARGVVHRDVKPANILLDREGSVYLADFGIARALAPQGARLTRPGVAVGSPVYMSPEQAAGETEVDGRSDVYSLGCVLFEMLAGSPPFEAPEVLEVLRLHLTAAPPSLRARRADVPPRLDAAVRSALAKDPAQRARSASAWAADLQAALEPDPSTDGRRRSGRRRGLLAVAAAALALAVGVSALLLPVGGDPDRADAAPSLTLRRVGVLYLDHAAGEDELAAISTGLTHSLIAELNRVEALEVASGNAVRRFRDTDTPPEEVARALGAGLLVTGRLRRVDDTLEVFVQVVEGEDGLALESRLLRRPFAQAFVLQDELAREVASALRRRIGERVRLQELQARAGSVDAWLRVQEAVNLRQEAREIGRRGGPVSEAAAARVRERADSLLREAERLDPEWSEPTLLRGWLRSDALGADVERTLEETDRITEEGTALAGSVLEARPDDPRGLELRGVLYSQSTLATTDPDVARRRLEVAEAELRRALELDPRLVQAWNALSRLLWLAGDFGGAARAAERALQEDAYFEDSAETMRRLAFAHLQLGQYGEMSRWCARGRQQHPDDWRFVECELAHMAYARGPGPPDADSASRLFAALEQMGSAGSRQLRRGDRLVWLAAVSAKVGRRERALELLDEALAERRRVEGHATVGLYDEAYVRLLLGQREQALDLLERFVREAPQFRRYVAGDVIFEPLFDHPRFRAMTSDSAATLPERDDPRGDGGS